VTERWTWRRPSSAKRVAAAEGLAIRFEVGDVEDLP
jgi:hypothetical protein